MKGPPCPRCRNTEWTQEDYDQSGGSVYRVLTCTHCGHQLTQTLYENRHGVLSPG